MTQFAVRLLYPPNYLGGITVMFITLKRRKLIICLLLIRMLYPSQPYYVNLTSGRRTLCRHYVVCQLAACVGPPSCRRLQPIQMMKMERKPTAVRPVGRHRPSRPSHSGPPAKPSAAASSQPAYRASWRWRPFSISNLFTGIFFPCRIAGKLGL